MLFGIKPLSSRSPLTFIGIAAAVYCLSFVTWITVAPGSDDFTLTGNNLLGIFGPLALAIVILARAFQPDANDRSGGRWAPSLLGLGIVLFMVGDSIWAFYEIILDRPTPFPSWADVAYLAGYPILLLGILASPVGRRSIIPRTRLALDGMMFMLIAGAVSWYIIIGPTLEADNSSFWATVLGLAYPLSDLVLVACLVLLWLRTIDDTLHRAFGLISAGLVTVICADGLFSYLELHGGYETGYVLTDSGWVIGYVLICLGAIVMQLQPRSAPASVALSDSDSESRDQVSPLLRMLLVYAMLPIVAALFLYARFTAEHGLPEQGVDVLSVALVCVVILRQVVAIIDNHHLQVETLAYAQRLEQLATTDPLTELSNHRTMMRFLDHEIERAERYGRQFSVLFLDLDHFKLINDTFGHPTGDTVLIEVAGVIRACVRNVDCVGRWGGEEFMIILPETDAGSAGATAERVRAAIASRSLTSGGISVTCSIGVATFGDDTRSRDKLIAIADEALYAAKRLGRNQVRAASDPATTAVMAGSADRDALETASMVGMVEALTILVAARDSYTARHAQEVGALAMRVALALGLTVFDAQTLSQAGQLHDIGKVSIPDAVLRKPGPLTPEEWVIMKRHAVVSAEVVSHVPALRHIAPIIRGHHERMDGRGYPEGLAAEAIPLGARILAVVDSYCAITTDRPHSAARSPAWALAELRRGAGTQFDPAVVEALVGVLATEPSLVATWNATALALGA